tara:strand:- start:264 stop:443 length:180 start_codon:yes stop_codon:yes gene_type:complete
MMDLRKDLLLCGILLTLKFTILPDLQWWMVILPLVLGFSINFIRGFLDGQKNGYEDRNK